MMLLILIITVPFMYLGIVFVTIILALLNVMLFIVTIAFPLACHYLLNREVQFKKEVRKIFGKDRSFGRRGAIARRLRTGGEGARHRGQRRFGSRAHR